MAQETINSPFLKKGPDTERMMLWMLACLTITALHFSVRYYPAYFMRFAICLLIGAAVEAAYVLLKDQCIRRPRTSTLVTSALLTLSLPAILPWPALISGVLVAVLFGKLIPDRNSIRLNPMLLGRLFVMIVFADLSQRWLIPGTPTDAISSATPLGLYAAEKEIYSLTDIMLGKITGDWEGVYAVIPGSPGEVLPILPVIFGVMMYLAGVLDWRPGIMYLLGMLGGCAALGLPLEFNMISGSTFFTAAYIITDPRTTPSSKSGRIIAGLVAGIFNAAIRAHGFYPEGVVFAVRAVNLLAPSIDKACFAARAIQLRRGG
jgi:Na+-translocating ferredoxin:NAD+ oxidoreductase subunit D